MNSIKNFNELPRIKDSCLYIYIEHSKIDRENGSITINNIDGKTSIPCASLSLIMLGPGTSITHAAIQTITNAGCLIEWWGENGVRFYASGQGETNSSYRLLKQAELAINKNERIKVVRKMYKKRFNNKIDESMSLNQLRGMEGNRVKNEYFKFSKKYKVEWNGRNYDKKDINKSDLINKLITIGNSCLYGICHAAIISLGYSPSIGFIHTGKINSFVYDIADLYKTKIVIPAAFEVASKKEYNSTTVLRKKLRDYFKENNLLKRIAKDIENILNIKYKKNDDSLKIWDPSGDIKSGINFSDIKV